MKTLLTKKALYAYIRVSTPKQGHGVSLQEQRDSIMRYTQRYGYTIIEWFEERKTAAKRGRLEFSKMLRQLKQRKALGVVIHKIDRSARNLRDWADLGELIDSGVEVHFANESLDLTLRGGRLSADIQAVVAADYIRNLREETKKGFYGRLKQGLYPLPAPPGYIDVEPGKPKAIDPVHGSFVREAFELYGAGNHSLRVLQEHLDKRGLRNRHGHPLCLNSLSVMLRNPFYIGLIRLRKTSETFAGVHPPLISPALFKRVQDRLDGKLNRKVRKHDLLFRRLLTCATCGRSLYGELQKGNVYYRCQTRTCGTSCLREDAIDAAALEALEPLRFNAQEEPYWAAKLRQLSSEEKGKIKERQEGLRLKLGQVEARLTRLTDAFIDGNLDKELFESRKSDLLLERVSTQEELSGLKENPDLADRLRKCLELAKVACFLYETTKRHEKRETVEILFSNRTIRGKSPEFALDFPFQMVAERWSVLGGGPRRDNSRINKACTKATNDTPSCPDDPTAEQIAEVWDALIPKLLAYLLESGVQRWEQTPQPGNLD